MSPRCPACDGERVETFYQRRGVPSHSCLLLRTAGEAAAFPTGDLRLALCSDCGFVYNQDFDTTLTSYSPDYEETQGYSEHFQQFIDDLAATWVDRYGLAGGRVVEIGCGKGEFLAALARHGVAEAVGIDPGVHPERIAAEARGRVHAVRGFFPRDMPVIDADAVVCRHTLEHIAPVRDFMLQIERATSGRPDTVLLFELPESLRVFEEGAFWDVYYEHCSYFSERSLTGLFRSLGWVVTQVDTVYDGQYILLEARHAAAAHRDGVVPRDPEGTQLREAVGRFSAVERDLVTRWTDELSSAGDRRVALWGSGSKAVAFLEALGDTASAVSAVVDINPNKWDRYMAGSAQRIRSPEELVDVKPDLVIAMNPVYVPEIGASLHQLGLSPELVSL